MKRQLTAASQRSLRLKSNSSWGDSIPDLESALDMNHQIKYSLIIRPLLHLVVESSHLIGIPLNELQ
ncbi:hypothetical protein C5S36_04525 [Candidatus Methanophagaceae archaeon]|nr:hypothetical protein C5S36_04525 [Methanophagales archaeon]